MPWRRMISVSCDEAVRLRTNGPSRVNSGSRIVPTRSLPRCACFKLFAAAMKSCAADTALCASGSSAAPASVKVRPPGVRLKSCRPVLSSRLFNCRLTAGWVRCSNDAARDTVPSRATVMKHRRAWERGRSAIWKAYTIFPTTHETGITLLNDNFQWTKLAVAGWRSLNQPRSCIFSRQGERRTAGFLSLRQMIDVAYPCADIRKHFRQHRVHLADGHAGLDARVVEQIEDVLV